MIPDHVMLRVESPEEGQEIQRIVDRADKLELEMVKLYQGSDNLALQFVSPLLSGHATEDEQFLAAILLLTAGPTMHMMAAEREQLYVQQRVKACRLAARLQREQRRN